MNRRTLLSAALSCLAAPWVKCGKRKPAIPVDTRTPPQRQWESEMDALWERQKTYGKLCGDIYKSRKDEMKACNYGHDFHPWDRKCDCGLDLRDFRSVHPWQRSIYDVCPLRPELARELNIPAPESA
jgi:hypothetical protein